MTERIHVGGDVSLEVAIAWAVRDRDGEACVDNDATAEIMRASLRELALTHPGNAPFRVDAFVSVETLRAACDAGVGLRALLRLLAVIMAEPGARTAAADANNIGILGTYVVDPPGHGIKC